MVNDATCTRVVEKASDVVCCLQLVKRRSSLRPLSTNVLGDLGATMGESDDEREALRRISNKIKRFNRLYLPLFHFRGAIGGFVSFGVPKLTNMTGAREREVLANGRID
eukprot:1538946-Amphidinium_carterae.1